MIVGHGPSLLSREIGHLIDSHDVVIRQKRCQDTLKYPHLYGSKVDVVCGSWTIAKDLPRVAPNAEYWVFMDSRHRNVPDSEVEALEDYIGCRIDRKVCDYWNRVYRAMRTPYTKPDGMQEFDPLGHPHLSAGFHAIIYACFFLEPEVLNLVGFDNIESGTFTWSITRGPDWHKYPDHRWDVEHKLLKEVEREFNTEIRFL